MEVIKIDSVISLFLYGALLIGVFIAFYDGLELIGRMIRKKKSLRERYLGKKEISRLDEHLNQIIGITLSGKVRAREYKIGTVILFCVSFFTFAKSLGLTAIPIAFLLCLLPYIILRLRLESVRNVVSNEAEQLVLSLLNQYKMSHKNIYVAIENTIKISEHLKATRKMLFQLLLEIRDTKNKEQIKKAVHRFSYGLKTNWSKMLGQCVLAAASDGVDVTRPMEELVKQLIIARKMEEEKKRLNSEGGRIVKYLVPFTYIGSIFVCIKYLDVPFNRIVTLQFKTEEGIWLFFIIFSMLLLNHLLMLFEKNSRFDY